MPSLIVFMLICFAIAGVAGGVTAPAVADWYSLIRKPSWTPPDAVFGPVWSVLYAMIAISGWLIWRRRKERDIRPAMAVYSLQLGLNFAWSLIFFGAQQAGFAVLDILVLWAAILITIMLFGRVSKAAAVLLVPYIVWVSFAACLNIAIWSLNR